jgi:transcriptional regulator with XRE-family HTH domain
MPNFTYLPGPEDPETVSTHGLSFTAGEWTPIPDDHAALAKLRGNRFFKEQEGTGSCPGETGLDANPLSQAEQSDADGGTELHETGNGSSGDSFPRGTSPPIPERQRPNNGPAVEITPLQCRAARAGLEWSREHLAELAKIGERTVTDFERHASNMLRSKRTAIRKAFEAAGVTFDASNGIWFAEPTAAPENSGETGAQSESADAIETEGEPLAA